MNRKQKQKGYECSQYRTYGKARCKCHEIKESDIIIHLKEFLKFTKEKYQDEINKIEIEVKTNKEQSNKKRIKFEIETLKVEYKVLLNQKIKELTNNTNEYQKNEDLEEKLCGIIVHVYVDRHIGDGRMRENRKCFRKFWY